MTETKKVKTFEEINRIDVSKNIEQKMGLSYLSWAWAHAEMKKIDEQAKIIIHEFPDTKTLVELASKGVTVTPELAETIKINYKQDSAGAYVKVSVVLNGRTETEYLPVMDMRNKSLVTPDSMSINKAHKRCFVKALALHGLGLYVYAGEDLPESEPVKKISVAQVKALNALIDETAKEADKTPSEMKALIFRKQNIQGEIKDLDVDQYGLILNYVRDLNKYYEKQAKEAAKEEPEQEKETALESKAEDAAQESLFKGVTTQPKL